MAKTVEIERTEIKERLISNVKKSREPKLRNFRSYDGNATLWLHTQAERPMVPGYPKRECNSKKKKTKVTWETSFLGEETGVEKTKGNTNTRGTDIIYLGFTRIFSKNFLP